MKPKVIAQFLSLCLLGAGFVALSASVSESDARLRAAHDASVAQRLEIQSARAQLAKAESALAEESRLRRRVAVERDASAAELLTAHDRLEKAYKDIADMEKQLVDVSRMKNKLEKELEELRKGWPEPYFPDRKIDGVVLGVSDKVNLVLISVGGKEEVRVGMTFFVTRDGEFVSQLIVDKVEDGWAACREMTEFRKKKIEQGDIVSNLKYD
jgi:hypothetical protein